MIRMENGKVLAVSAVTNNGEQAIWLEELDPTKPSVPSTAKHVMSIALAENLILDVQFQIAYLKGQQINA